MGLRGTRKFVVHYGGKWNESNYTYEGCKSVRLNDIDGDEMCFMDLVKEIEQKTGLLEFELSYLVDFKKCVVCKDADLLHMWDQVKATRGVYHLYILPNPGPPRQTLPNKYSPTILPKTLITAAIRKSPRLSTNPATTSQPNSTKSAPCSSKPNNSAPYLTNRGTSAPISTPKSKKKLIFTKGARRSPRLACLWRSKFTSKEPVVLSSDDDEESVTKNKSKPTSFKARSQSSGKLDLNNLAKDISNLDVHDDRAINHLIETINYSDVDELLEGYDYNFTDDEHDYPAKDKPSKNHIIVHSPLTLAVPTEPETTLDEPLSVEYPQERIDVLSQSYLLGFNAANPEDNYHSESESSGEEESFFGDDASGDDEADVSAEAVADDATEETATDESEEYCQEQSEQQTEEQTAQPTQEQENSESLSSMDKG